MVAYQDATSNVDFVSHDELLGHLRDDEGGYEEVTEKDLANVVQHNEENMGDKMTDQRQGKVFLKGHSMRQQLNQLPSKTLRTQVGSTSSPKVPRISNNVGNGGKLTLGGHVGITPSIGMPYILPNSKHCEHSPSTTIRVQTGSIPSIRAHVGSTPPLGALHTTTLDSEHVEQSPLGTFGLSPYYEHSPSTTVRVQTGSTPSIRADIDFSTSVRAHASSSSPSVGAHVGSTPPLRALHTTTLDFEHVEQSPLGTSSLSPHSLQASNPPKDREFGPLSSDA
ncbi:hypothetical protein VNO78_09095 [Psophocarpus tetragonolobus]|uniref:Uncharacterized protein n=1 Tax=Psophocarpus tetragonolobus TaxID=3891 RepID=A0AAN9SX67_PSOTE